MMQPPTADNDGLPSGVSVVVPVYNGAGSIEQLAQRVDATLSGEVRWELIFVVDGSPDNSWEIVERTASTNQNLVGVRLFRNFGQHNALLAGIRTARYDVIVTMDDDLQHRPETIPALLEALEPSIDLVYGQSAEEEHGVWRNLASRGVKSAVGASIGGDMAGKSGAFRAFRTSLRDGFSDVNDPYVSIDVLLSWVTTSYTTASTPMDRRTIGTSNYTLGKLIGHSSNMITGYSTKPLRLVSWMGFILAFFGLLTLIYVVIRYFLSDSDVPGFAFLASLISILAGAQLFGLGVIGEYLGRMHVRSMQRPPYVIREICARASESESSAE